MRMMRIKHALLGWSLSGGMLIGPGGCTARPPLQPQSQLQSAQIRPATPQTVEQRLATFTAARPLATVGVVNAVIPERRILQVQGIEPRSVAIGQVIVVVANDDPQNPIHATVFDRQSGFLQLRYGDDAGRSQVPRTGDIAFCYLPKAIAPQRVEATKHDINASRFSAGATTKPSLASSPPKRRDASAEAPPTQAARPIDVQAVSHQSYEEEPSAPATQEVGKPSVAAAPQSRPVLPPNQTEASAASRLVDNAIESQSTPTQLLADSKPADASPDHSTPVGGSDPAPSRPAEPAEDLRALIGVQLSGRRHVEVPKLPPISVQGYVHADGGDPMALLQIGDAHKVYLVQKGTEISITVAGDVTPVGKNELTGLPGPKGSDTPAEAAPKGAQESLVILKVQKITNEGVILETGLAQTLTVR